MKQQLIKRILSLQGETPEIIELKEFANSCKNKIANKNAEAYQKDIELSRLKRKINNSRMAIKKAWKNRSSKSGLIKKHIKILRSISENK